MSQDATRHCETAAARRQGRLIVLSGPAGVGKTTVAERVCRELGIQRSISATTRAPRPGEQDGRDYYFLSEHDFRERLARGEFLEHAQVHDHLYGTPRRPVEEAVEAGEGRLLVIDVQGAMQVKARKPDALLIFLDAPDEATRQQRIAGRSTESPKALQARRAAAEAERRFKEHYDHTVINDDLDRTVAELCRLISASDRSNGRRH